MDLPNPITLDHIEAITRDAYYYQPYGMTLTVCMVRLPNGFVVTGTSACADPREFDAAVGKQLAMQDARRQVWTLEGYRLRHQLWLDELRAAEPKEG